MILDASQVSKTTSNWIQMLHQSKPFVNQFPVHLKEGIRQEIDKMLKVGVLKPVHEVLG